MIFSKVNYTYNQSDAYGQPADGVLFDWSGLHIVCMILQFRVGLLGVVTCWGEMRDGGKVHVLFGVWGTLQLWWRGTLWLWGTLG